MAEQDSKKLEWMGYYLRAKDMIEQIRRMPSRYNSDESHVYEWIYYQARNNRL